MSDSCSAQPNCTSCNTFSTCHWCSFDDACHTIGSVYGCLTGTSCYSIDSCFRSEPEPAPPLPAGSTVATVVICLALLLCCCATCWLGIARAIKTTFQELLFKGLDDNEEEEEQGVADGRRSEQRRPRPLPVPRGFNFFEMKSWSSSSSSSAKNKKKKGRSPSLELGEDDDMSYDAALMGGSVSPTSSSNSLSSAFAAAVESGSAKPGTKYGRVPDGSDDDNDDDDDDDDRAASPNTGDRNKASTRAASALPNRRPVPPTVVKYRKYPSSPIDCVWNSCVCVYVSVIVVVVVVATASLVMWPQYPQYNLCSDELDWKSIVDGMTSAKLEASFELLLSVYNPNHFDVDVISGTGTFHHDGILVGTFDLGESISHKVSSLAITDVLVTVTFTTDQWEALALSTEYYKGTLTFLVDANVAFKIPAFMYTGVGKWKEYFVHVGDETGDRSLCACPEWS